MTALAAGRLATFQQGNHQFPETISARILTATTCYQGGIAAMTSAGYVAPATATTGLLPIGVFTETVVNSGASGAKRVKVRPGVFSFNNATSTDACAVTDVGKTVYILDDNTVTITSSGHTAVGKLIDILDNGQCQVLIGPGVL